MSYFRVENFDSDATRSEGVEIWKSIESPSAFRISNYYDSVAHDSNLRRVTSGLVSLRSRAFKVEPPK